MLAGQCSSIICTSQLHDCYQVTSAYRMCQIKPSSRRQPCDSTGPMQQNYIILTTCLASRMAALRSPTAPSGIGCVPQGLILFFGKALISFVPKYCTNTLPGPILLSLCCCLVGFCTCISPTNFSTPDKCLLTTAFKHRRYVQHMHMKA